jgi:hypothetical protein
VPHLPILRQHVRLAVRRFDIGDGPTGIDAAAFDQKPERLSCVLRDEGACYPLLERAGVPRIEVRNWEVAPAVDRRIGCRAARDLRKVAAAARCCAPARRAPARRAGVTADGCPSRLRLVGRRRAAPSAMVNAAIRPTVRTCISETSEGRVSVDEKSGQHLADEK